MPPRDGFLNAGSEKFSKKFMWDDCFLQIFNQSELSATLMPDARKIKRHFLITSVRNANLELRE